MTYLYVKSLHIIFVTTWFAGLFYIILRIVLIFPIYQITLPLVGWLFGQFKFFWDFEKKMLQRMGLGRFFK